ncbi:MAG: hypothetical protein IPJ88_07480 [Myxococcales bacterium]|nr:MAG: hypothetical protein IPJ88_07480 [Myxococcales bacterium]
MLTLLKKHARVTLMLFVIICAVTAASSLHAISTRQFSIDTDVEFIQGELDQTVAFSDGTVRGGAKLSRIGLSDVPVAFSALRSSSGSLFIGTGNEGKLQIRRQKVSEFADTKSWLSHRLLKGLVAIFMREPCLTERFFASVARGKSKALSFLKEHNIFGLCFLIKRKTRFTRGLAPRVKCLPYLLRATRRTILTPTLFTS